ncbi:MAG: hypothetical protein WDW38_011248 [Sanguina aurantia]
MQQEIDRGREEGRVQQQVPDQQVQQRHAAHVRQHAEDSTMVCVRASGTWLLLSDHNHNQDNLFEETISSWYPPFLMTHYALPGLDPSTVRITYLGGNKKGFLAFQEVYQMLGRYMPWQLVLSRAGGQPQCIDFDTTITMSSQWAWLNKPVVAGPNPGLTSFTSAMVRHFGHSEVRPGICKRTLLYGVRERNYRRILNRDAVVAAMEATLPDFELIVTDLAALSLGEQIRLLRSADVFMFEHGGAGPLVMFQSPGSVAFEIFPYDFADPMYRNMAIMTGKVYFAWQNARKENAQGLETMHRSSNTIADVPSLMAVLSSVRDVVSNNAGAKFFRPSGEPYMRGLCDWCSHDQKHFACGPEDD